MPPPLPEDDSDVDQDMQDAIRDRLKPNVQDESDEQSQTDDEKPPGRQTSVKDEPAEEEEDEDEEDDDEEGDEDEFVVEAIKDHVYSKGQLSFLVKWEGWEKKADMTWEPEDSLLEGAEEILNAYLEAQGGREAIISQTASKGKKRSRKSNTSAAQAAEVPLKRSRKNAQHPADSTPPVTASKKWSPPAGSWEDEIEEIQTEPDENGKLIVYLTWKNSQRTRHDTSVIYKKCPQRMLKFYEQHVRIVTGADQAE